MKWCLEGYYNLIYVLLFIFKIVGSNYCNQSLDFFSMQLWRQYTQRQTMTEPIDFSACLTIIIPQQVKSFLVKLLMNILRLQITWYCHRHLKGLKQPQFKHNYHHVWKKEHCTKRCIFFYLFFFFSTKYDSKHSCQIIMF